MKTVKIILSLCILSFAFLMVGCNRMEVTPQGSNLVTLKIFAGFEGDMTKTFITDNGNKSYTPAWSVGDEIYLSLKSGSNSYVGKATHVTGIEFNGEVTAADGTYSLEAWYPNIATLTLPAHQYPSKTSFDKNSDLLKTAAPNDFTVSANKVSSLNLNFVRQTSIVKLSFNGFPTPAFGDEIVQKVIFTTEDCGIAGDLGGTPTSTISAYYTDGPKISEATVFLSLLPSTLATGKKLTVTVETKNYSVTKQVTATKDYTFERNKVMPLSMSLSSGCTIHKNMTYDFNLGNPGVSTVYPTFLSGFMWPNSQNASFREWTFINAKFFETHTVILNPAAGKIGELLSPILTNFKVHQIKFTSGKASNYDGKLDIYISTDGGTTWSSSPIASVVHDARDRDYYLDIAGGVAGSQYKFVNGGTANVHIGKIMFIGEETGALPISDRYFWSLGAGSFTTTQLTFPAEGVSTMRWTLTPSWVNEANKFFGFDGGASYYRGLQIGSSSALIVGWTLKSSDYTKPINSILITPGGMSGSEIKVGITVNGVGYKQGGDLNGIVKGSSSTSFTFTPDGTAQSGEIVITCNNNSSSQKATYLKEIKINY